MNLFGVGGQEMIWIAILAVVLFGDKLPEVMRTAAKISKRVKDASQEFQDALRLDD